VLQLRTYIESERFLPLMVIANLTHFKRDMVLPKIYRGINNRVQGRIVQSGFTLIRFPIKWS